MIAPPPDDDEIRYFLEAALGRQTRLDFFSPVTGSPIDVVLKAGSEWLGTEFLVYWAKGGSPRIFALNDFSKPVVVFGERLVEIWADFRAIFTSNFLSAELKSAKSEQIILRTMAEISLTLIDDPSLPTQLAIAAAERCPGLLSEPNTLPELEYEERGLPYMNCWFFAFAHELGHFHPNDSLPNWVGVAKEALIRNVDILQEVPKSHRERMIENIEEQRTGPLFDIAQIITEATADANAMFILFESAFTVMSGAGLVEDFNMYSFYHEVIISLNFVATFGQIEQILKIRRHRLADTQATLELSFYKSVVGARIELALHLFQVFVRARYPDVEHLDVEEQQQVVAHTLREMQSDIVDWDRAVAVAMTTLFELELPCDIAGFLNRLNTIEDASEIQHLITTAQKAGKESWHFQALSQKTDDIKKRVGIEDIDFGVAPETYIIATVVASNQKMIPVCVYVEDCLACFVFNTNELFKDFTTLLTNMLGDGFSITMSTMLVNNEMAVLEQMEMWLRPLVHAKVLVEGTVDFDRDYQLFLNQTAEIGSIGLFCP